MKKYFCRIQSVGSQQNGQALVTLLFFMIIGVTITAAATIIAIVNIKGTSTQEQGVDAYYAAESGMENSLMRFLRNSSYLGESLTLDQNSSVTSTISAGVNNMYTFTATGSSYQSRRTVQVTAVYNNDILTISSWKEIQ